MSELSQLKQLVAVFLDGDGVLWNAREVIPGTKPFLDFLSREGIKWALLTNNNTRITQYYIDKFSSVGIEAGEEMIFTSATATAAYATEEFGSGARLHVIGMAGLKETLQQAGFTISYGEQMPEQDVVAVIAGEDFEINFNKIKVAMRLILQGAKFIATNDDSFSPTPEGIDPGTGLVVGALQATTKVKPTIIGKPQSAIYQQAIKRLGVSPGKVLMVGDTLDTDILGAADAGIMTSLVLSGVTSREAATESPIKPDFIFEDIAELHQALAKSRA